ncbi:MAG: PRC-barrel domain-containing protein [Anaerolineales bacterium]
MEIPLGVDVHCSDGRCGRSTHIIINPATEKVTHIVVKTRDTPIAERLVPVDWIAATASEVIVLHRSRSEFNTLDLFRAQDFVLTDVPHFATDPKLTLLWPFVVPAKRIVDQTIKRIPPGELSVRRGAAVHATDGRVGTVDEFVVGPRSGNITHLRLREGNIFGRRDVCVPVSNIERIEADGVHLKLDRESVQNLPSLTLKRRRW